MVTDLRGNEVAVGDAVSLWMIRDAEVPPPEGEVLAIVKGQVIIGYGQMRASRIPVEEFGGFSWVKWTEEDAAALEAKVRAEAARVKAEDEAFLASLPAENLAISPEDFE
ncbi:MAG: hypothetical protein KDA16_11905 [Phycisphaerales bacterium]|nr:hypothetical protein [Phycisphaerales bacterium]